MRLFVSYARHPYELGAAVWWSSWVYTWALLLMRMPLYLPHDHPTMAANLVKLSASQLWTKSGRSGEGLQSGEQVGP